MDLVRHFRKMARNNAWSNHRLYAACSRLSDEELKATRTSFFSSLLATLNHILAVDHYYTDALEGGGRGPAAFYDYKPFDAVAELRTAQAASDLRLTCFCDRLAASDTARLVTTDRGKGGMWEETIGNLLAHLYLHQIHHRGQVHAMLAGTSVPPPQLDEYFLAFDHEAREGDLVASGIGGPETVT